jgi:TonB-dependent starch-binding outer membrane protein SusC
MSRFRWLTAILVAAAVFPAGAWAQERGTITGQVVVQETRQPLQGAQVRVAGMTLGTLTNQQGRFIIPNVPQGPQTIQVTFIGYKQATAAVTVGASAAEVTVEMAADVLGLDELVVVGYGTERRRNVAGAVSSLRTEGVQELPTPSVNNVLQGRLAGVQVTQNSGNPGAAISVRVRGSSSISAGNAPLYVIDGVPMTQGNYSRINATFGGQGVDALSDLNPNEIESIEVLKDASAAAIYGSRASNGVVLITTRRGIAGRSQANFNSYVGVQNDWRRLEMLDADEWIAVKNEGILNRFGIPDYFGYGEDNEVQLRPGVNTNWLDEVMRSAPIASMDGSLRGGTERAQYFLSGSAFQQDGIVRGFGYERLNGRLNLDYQPFDRLTLGTNVSLARGIVNRSRGDNTVFGPFANAVANPPVESVYDEDGSYTRTTYANPVGLALENEAEERSIRVLGNTFASVEVFPGVNARASFGLDQYTLRSRLYDSPLVGLATGSGGSGTAANSFVNKSTYEGTLNFARSLNEQNALSGVVGASYENNTEEWSSVSGQQFPSEVFRYLTSAATITGGTSAVTEWSLLSYFGRLSHTWNDRVTTTVNLRADGSSRFGEDNRFGFFPSASVLYRLGDEPFMRSQNLFSDLALRLSYGRTGNQQNIGNFASRGLFGGGFNYNDLPGIAPTQLANPSLRWETTDQLNVGTDMAFLNNRLSLGLDYYVKRTNDLLVARPVPRTTGFASIWSNVGSMENRGVELTSRLRLLDGGQTGLNWTTDVNLARNRNEVTSLLNDEPINAGFASRIQVGQPLGAFYGYQTAGIFRDGSEICRTQAGETAAARNERCAALGLAFQAAGTAPGDIRFADLNGDGIITDADRTIIGTPWPKLEGGVTNTLSFRGFDATVFTQFSYGNEIYNAMRTYTDDFGSYDDNHTRRALDRWTPANPDATEPRAVYGDPNRNTRASDRFIEDGSYLRLKNVVLGYTLPADMSGRLGFRSMRVYLQGQNLLTFTGYSGFDPEVNYAGDTAVTRGTDFYTLPQARTVTAGFNIGL